MCGASIALISFFDMNERFVVWARAHEYLDLDEWPLVFAILSIGFGIFAARRWSDLKVEIANRKRMAAALHRERDFGKALLDTAGSLIIVLDRQGCIVQFNHVCERTSGYTFDEVRGRLIWSLGLFLENEVAELRNVFTRLESGNFPNEHENHWLARDGARRLIAWANTVMLDSNSQPEYLVGIGIDITERQRVEDALRASERRHVMLLTASERQARNLELLNRTIAAVASVLEPSAVLAIICEQLARAFNLTQAAAALLDPSRTCLVVVAEYCAPDHPSALGEHISVNDNPATYYVLTKRTSLTVPDAQTDPRLAAFHELAKQRGTVSLLIVPLAIRGEIVGTLGLDATERREFATEEVQLAETVAAAAGRALENANLYEEIQQELLVRKRAEAMSRTLLEAVPEPLVIVNAIGRIVRVNYQTERLFGYDRSELVGQPLEQLLPDTFRAIHAQHFATYVAMRKLPLRTHGNNLEVQRKDGSRFPIELSLNPIETEEGTLIIGAIRDITERRRVERLKNEFVATVSHELRTPLTSVRGALGLIAGGVTGPLPAQAKSMIEIALGNSERLMRLLNDLLDVEKIESGKLSFELKPLAIMPLVELALEANRAYADQYGVQFVIDHDAPGTIVHADADRLMQVFTNLLANAVKFSPRNGTVRVGVFSCHNGLRIAVRDSGPGVPAEFQGRIFQKFAQADASDTRQKGGTGLGLSIAKAIVEKHGGRIGYENHDGAGATFFVELPADDPTRMV
jgi:PAS domain S-box-containing protein